MASKRNSPSLTQLSRRLSVRDKDLRWLLEKLIEISTMQVRALKGLQAVITSRLPVWADDAEEKTPAPKLERPN